MFDIEVFEALGEIYKEGENVSMKATDASSTKTSIGQRFLVKLRSIEERYQKTLGGYTDHLKIAKILDDHNSKNAAGIYFRLGHSLLIFKGFLDAPRLNPSTSIKILAILVDDACLERTKNILDDFQHIIAPDEALPSDLDASHLSPINYYQNCEIHITNNYFGDDVETTEEYERGS